MGGWTRIDLASIEHLINNARYFVLHVPRQTGKTTCLLALMRHLNAQGTYRALYVHIEAAHALRSDVEKAIAIVCNVLVTSAALSRMEAGGGL